jgi:methionine-S-sulfoxide reductase
MLIWIKFPMRQFAGGFDAPARRPGAALLILSLFAALWQTPVHAAGSGIVLPAPAIDAPKSGSAGVKTVVLAGGCFWGVQLVFQHVKGVRQAVSGYTGGAKDTAVYEAVSSGTTGHAEAVQVTFDPRRISLGRVLQIYFSVAHDPTELNRQGPDTGTQYRSAIFYRNDTQKNVAEAYIAQLGKAGVFKAPIVTELDPLTEFYPAEAYHQNYGTLHPNSPYIAYYDLPMVETLKRLFADLYREKPVLVPAAAPAVAAAPAAAPVVAAPLEEGNAAYMRGDYATAERLLRPLAEEGNATAQFDLGGMYYHGRGVPQDYAAALTWYGKAADQGDPRAENGLGDMYLDGSGVAQDSAAALAWYRKSADQGHSSAQYNLGAMYENGADVPQDYAEALKWFRLAAEQGDGRAQVELGAMYENGQGTPRDYAEALKWFRKAADQASPAAQYNLGQMYRLGNGVPQNDAAAAKWYRLAAKNGYAAAQSNLGAMYAKGQGVRQDYADALKWFHLAADHGDIDAQFNIAGIYGHGQGVPQDYAEAAKWYRLAAEQGYPFAQNSLGILYAQGQGVAPDYVQAYMWFNLAATRIRASNTEKRDLIIKNRDAVAAKMTPAQIEEAQRLADEWKPKAD